MGLKIKNGVVSGYTPLTRRKPDLEIPEGVTEIAPEAFRDQPNLWTVRLPASLRTIGDAAFEQCTDLKEVQLPAEGLETIGDAAFEDCVRLESFSLPDTVSRIGSRAFALCRELRISALPARLVRLEKSAFDGCKQLAEVLRIPDTISAVGDKAFNHCHALRELQVPIGFRGTALTALGDCTALETLTVCSASREYRFAIGKQEQIPDYSEELSLLLEHNYRASLPESVRQRLLCGMFVSGYDENAAAFIDLHSRELLDSPELLDQLIRHGRLIRADNINELIAQAGAAGFHSGEEVLLRARDEVFGSGMPGDMLG